MKVIVAGCRSIENYRAVVWAIKASGFEVSEVVSGGAQGVDRLGERYAKENKIPVRQFLPNWKHLGRVAGIVRNQQMGLYADALVAVWDQKSKGTNHMIEYMRDKMMKPTYVVLRVK